MVVNNATANIFLESDFSSHHLHVFLTASRSLAPLKKLNPAYSQLVNKSMKIMSILATYQEKLDFIWYAS